MWVWPVRWAWPVVGVVSCLHVKGDEGEAWPYSDAQLNESPELECWLGPSVLKRPSRIRAAFRTVSSFVALPCRPKPSHSCLLFLWPIKSCIWPGQTVAEERLLRIYIIVIKIKTMTLAFVFVEKTVRKSRSGLSFNHNLSFSDQWFVHVG